MATLYQQYSYEHGVSYPAHQLIPDYVSNQYSTSYSPLYSDSLQSVAHSAEISKSRLKKKLVQIDQNEARMIINWRTEDGSKGKKIQLPDYPFDAEKPKWDTVNSFFNSQDDFQHQRVMSRNENTKSNEGVNSLCYLCTTLEEHKKHVAKRGPQLKAKEKLRLRTEFIAPPPTVKFVPKEVDERAEVLYKFSVRTGHFANAGTSANVTVKLKGTRGIMRKRILKKKTCGNFTFGRGTTETFYIKGPKIGDISMLCIEHDGLQQSHAWYLEEVEVTNMTTEQSFVFVCKNWLSLYHGDFELKKVLRAQIREYEPRDFEVTVVTADKVFAGTDANVFITIYGQKGVSRKLPLKNKSKNNFEKGNKDKFQVEVKEDIGKVSKIRLEHDNSGAGPGWLVEQVSVSDESTGRILNFPCGRWLATDEEDGLTQRDLFPLRNGEHMTEHGDRDGKSRKQNTRYEITVLTGKLRYAGTDARVYMSLFGKKGKSSEFELVDKTKDLFEQGQTDIFKISSEDVGELKRIRVRHDNAGLGAGWYLEKITLKRYFSSHEIKEKLHKMGVEMDEKMARRASKIAGTDIDSSPSHHRGGKKALDEDDDDSDSDLDTTNIFNKNKNKKSGKTDRKKKKKSKDDDSDDSQQKLKNKYKGLFDKGGSRKDRFNSEDESEEDSKYDRKSRHKRKGEKQSASESDNSDSDSDEDSDTHSRKRKNKKMKWISHGGYRIQVTDDEAEKRDQKLHGKERKNKRQSKFSQKYPTDTSESEEDQSKNDRKKLRKSKKEKGKYYSDSDSGDERKQRRKSKSRKSSKHRHHRGENSDDSEDDTGVIGRSRSPSMRRKSKGRREEESLDDSESSGGSIRGEASSVWKKNRVPYFDEYVFECNKWFAEDEGDKLIDRELKANTVTTFYKMN